MTMNKKTKADGIFCVRSLSIKNLEKLAAFEGLSVAVVAATQNAVFNINATFLIIKKAAAENITGIKICSTASAVLVIKALYKLGVRGVGLFLNSKGALFAYGLTVNEFLPPSLAFNIIADRFVNELACGKDCFSAFSEAWHAQNNSSN